MDYVYPFLIWVLILFGAISVASLGLLLTLRLKRIRMPIIMDESAKRGW